MELETASSTSVEVSSPAGTPIWTKAPNRPRRPFGAYSVDISTAPPHSPPTPSPWTRRSTTSSTGARNPIDAYVGSSPISVVATPIITSEMISMFLRPRRSPKWPKTTPPIGRATKPAPKVPKAASVAAVSPRLGEKKILSKTSAAAAP